MTMEWGMDQQAIEAGLGPAFFLSLGIFLLVVLAIGRAGSTRRLPRSSRGGMLFLYSRGIG